MTLGHEYLIHLSLEDALKEKWSLGRAKYGEEFRGHPLIELWLEMLDSIHYCRVAQEQGYNLGDLDEQLREVALNVQRLFLATKENENERV